MHKSELPADPDLGIPQIPVICDKCRDTGMAGDGAFSAIPDILNFTPVQRRAHVNGWREEHQRAFIAALAITGSPRQAARAIGKHQFGAEQLRNARNGRSFAAAWDAAMELARERETHRIHDSLKGLASQRDEQLTRISPPLDGEGRGRGRGDGGGSIHPDCDYDPDVHTDDYPEYWEAQNRIRERLLHARRMLLFLIGDDEEKRRAWEVLIGPTDWGKALALEPQPDEPQRGEFMNPHGLPNMRQPDMLLTAEAGLLPEMTGGPDLMAEIRRAVAEERAAQSGRGPDEDQAEDDAQATPGLGQETTPSGQPAPDGRQD